MTHDENTTDLGSITLNKLRVRGGSSWETGGLRLMFGSSAFGSQLFGTQMVRLLGATASRATLLTYQSKQTILKTDKR